MRNPQRTSNVSSFVHVLSCNLISERELSWCLVAVSVDFLVPMGILSWQIPTFALNKGAHLPLVPTRPHHVEVGRGFRDPALNLNPGIDDQLDNFELFEPCTKFCV